MNALGMIEVLSIPNGIEVCDAMLKTAAVRLLVSQTACAGKYICAVAGEVAAVRECVEVGKNTVGDTLIDSIVIPNIHEDVLSAINACTEVKDPEAIGVMETYSLAAAVLAADTSVKAADIQLLEVRLGRGMGGKAFVLLTGAVAAVKAAVQAGERMKEVEGLMAGSVVIPSPHPELIKQLA